MATTDRWPKDTDDTFYVPANHCSIPLADIMEKATAKWAGITPDKLEIEPDHVHLYCVGYDQFDASDWALFLKITRIP